MSVAEIERIVICPTRPSEVIDDASGAVDEYLYDFNRASCIPKMPEGELEPCSFEIHPSSGVVTSFSEYFRERGKGVHVVFESHVTQFCRDFREEILNGGKEYYFLLMSPSLPTVSFSGERPKGTFYLARVSGYRGKIEVLLSLLPLFKPDVDPGKRVQAFIVVSRI